MDSKTKVILISVIVGVLVIGLVVGANVSGKAVATPEEIATDFAIDAWGYKGWGDCSSQYGTRAQLDAFCASTGFAELAKGDACKHTPASNRWRWDGKLPMTQGRSTGNGDALTKVKCTGSGGSQTESPTGSGSVVPNELYTMYRQAFNDGDVYQVSDHVYLNDNTYGEISALCRNANDIILSGSCSVGRSSGVRIIDSAATRYTGGHPYGNPGWQCKGANTETSRPTPRTVDWSGLSAHGYCLKA